MKVPEGARKWLEGGCIEALFNQRVIEDTGTPAAILVAQQRKRKVARRLLLALKLQEETNNRESVVGRLISLADNVETLEETVEKVTLSEKERQVAGNKMSPPASGAGSTRK